MEKENTDLMFNAAKTIYEYPGTDENCKAELAKMFPRLKIPENDRIREDIMDFLRMHICGRKLDSWCNWLMKQKEQKSIEDVAKDITKNKETATKFLKSAGIMDDNGELAEMYRSEQKPAKWNDDDEIWAHLILRELEKAKENSPEYSRHFARLIDWFTHRFKSFRLQSKQEWDETDKTQLLQIIEEGVTKSLCRKGFHFHFDEEYAKDLIEYICSFNPSKSNWKPSEEQINALKVVVRGYPAENLDAIESLLKDLQKLI